ncbi:MAG: alpha/beta hydrolase [Deltaproteobacteria bacterium]|nr:alpha/beta hydrolase [Deltaproteobacteria bacterium]
MGASGDVVEASRATSTDEDAAVSVADARAAAVEEAVASAREAAKRAPPRDARLRLVEHSGDPSGPIGYQVIEPDDATPTTPIVIALHGMGDTPDGFGRFVKQLSLRARVFVGRGPEPWGMTGGRQWYVNDAADAPTQLRARAKDLVALADKVRALYPEAGKPALVGFSQGAALALQATLEYPDAWRAVAALSGFVPSDAGAKTPSAVVPVLVVAGDSDTRVPTRLSWYAAGALKKHGHQDVRKLEFKGGHKIPAEVVEAVRAFFAEVLGRE